MRLVALACTVVVALGVASRAGATGSSPDSSHSQSWTPDGSALIYQAQVPVGIRRVTLAGEISTLLESRTFARVSPRGELAFVANADVTSPFGALTVKDVSGRSRVLAQAAEYGGLAWSPDGGAIAFQARSGRLATANADGTGLHEFPYVGNDPAWSPDGTRIAFTRGAETAVVDIRAGTAQAVGPASVDAGGFHIVDAYPSAVWSPDSTRLAIALNPGVEVVRGDGSGREARFEDALFPSWSPNGSELALQRESNIVAARADGSSQRVVVASAMNETRPTWSPDGGWIAYTNINVTPPGQAYQAGHAADVFIVRPDGSDRRSLTGGCATRDDTPLAWLCVVNGRWSVPLADAPSPTVRIAIHGYARAIRVPVNVTDGQSYVYGAGVTARQLAGPRVRVTTVTGKSPSLLTDTGGRAAFRFLRPSKHGTVTLRVVAAGRSRVVRIRV